MELLSDQKNQSSNRNWEMKFHELSKKSSTSPFTEALKTKNRPLNRYRDVNPYDHSRIILQQSSNDYINANLVQVKQADRKYILTQGPLKRTVNDFWLMVWQQNSAAVIMLNNVMEKNEMKSYPYWPSAAGKANKMNLDGITVQLLNEVNHELFTIRTIQIYNSKAAASRDILHFHYTTWPDFGVPSSPKAFLEFLNRVRDSGVLKPNHGPPVVHCSAGIGRSGTFCLVDSALVMIEKVGLDAVKIEDILLEMRHDRMGLIQTSDQLRFSYEAIFTATQTLGLDKKTLKRLPCTSIRPVGQLEVPEESTPKTPSPLPNLLSVPEETISRTSLPTGMSCPSDNSLNVKETISGTPLPGAAYPSVRQLNVQDNTIVTELPPGTPCRSTSPRKVLDESISETSSSSSSPTYEIFINVPNINVLDTPPSPPPRTGSLAAPTKPLPATPYRPSDSLTMMESAPEWRDCISGGSNASDYPLYARRRRHTTGRLREEQLPKEATVAPPADEAAPVKEDPFGFVKQYCKPLGLTILFILASFSVYAFIKR